MGGIVPPDPAGSAWNVSQSVNLAGGWVLVIVSTANGLVKPTGWRPPRIGGQQNPDEGVCANGHDTDGGRGNY